MTSLLSPATLWFILGVLLFVIEFAVSGFLAVFFAVGAWVTAILIWLGVLDVFWMQLAVFLIVSIVSLVLLRKKLKAVMGVSADSSQNTDAQLDDFIGKLATVIESIDPAKNTGKVEFRGTNWSAQSNTFISEGASVRIINRDNLTLTVETN